MTTIGTPHVDVDLNLLLTPCTLIGTCHADPHLYLDLLDYSINRTLGNLHRRSLRLVCATGKLEPALAALPDTGTLARYGFHVTLGAAVMRTRNLFNIIYALAHKSSVPATKTTGTSCYFSFCFMS